MLWHQTCTATRGASTPARKRDNGLRLFDYSMRCEKWASRCVLCVGLGVALTCCLSPVSVSRFDVVLIHEEEECGDIEIPDRVVSRQLTAVL